jgi:hypothetical protein
MSDSPVYDRQVPAFDPYADATNLVEPFGDHRDDQVMRYILDNPLHLREALDGVDQFVGRFVHFDCEAQRHAVVLWIAETWVFDAFDVAPYLHIKSPEKSSGKTQLLEAIEMLCRSALRTSNLSSAALFRAVDELHPTLLIDEADAVFPARGGRNGDGSREELRGLVNSGYRRGDSTLRIGGKSRDQLEKFDSFGPKAFAGIGELPDTIADRAIPIRLQRKPKSVSLERFRYRIVRGEAVPVADRLVAALQGLDEMLACAHPLLPDQLSDRAQDIWEPLLAIAEYAGGYWPNRALAAAVQLHTGDDGADETIGVRLLGDCRTAFGSDEMLWTDRLLERLNRMEESPWADWAGRGLTARVLAYKLRPYGIRSGNVRTEDGQRKGYRRTDFVGVWDRYLGNTEPLRSSQASESSQSMELNALEPSALLSQLVPRPSQPRLETPGTAQGRQGDATVIGPNSSVGGEWDCRDG